MAKFVRLLIIVVLLFSVVACSGAERERQKIQKLEERALKGDLEAQNELSNIYYEGTQYTKQDEKEAFKWTKMMADAGHRGAMYNIAVFYDKGYGVDVDYTKSFYYRLRAAHKNSIDCQKLLIIHYLDGIGTEKDPYQALVWSYVLEYNHESFYIPENIKLLKELFSEQKRLEAQTEARIIFSNFDQPPSKIEE